MAGLGEWPIEREWTQSPPFRDPGMVDGRGTPGLVYAPPGTKDTSELARQRMLARELVWWQQLAPHQAPPFRATPLLKNGRAVLNAPSAAAAGVIGAGLMATAYSVIETCDLLPSTAEATNKAQIVCEFTIPQGQRAVVRGWGAEVATSLTEMVKFSLRVGGQQGGSNVDLAAISDLEHLVATCMLGTGGEKVQILARNLSTVVGVFVQVAFCGWLYPVLQTDDSLRSSLPTSGGQFGPGETNGRFTEADSCPPNPCGPGNGGGR